MQRKLLFMFDNLHSNSLLAMFRFLREVWIQHGLLWGDPLIGVHHKEPGQLESEEKGEEVTHMLKWKMVGSHLGNTIVLKMQCLALWQSLSTTGSSLASSKCYTTLAIGTLPFWSTANCEGICWWGKYNKTNVQKLYMVTLWNHSAVTYSSHKNLKHRFFKSNFPIYSMVLYPCMDWNTWTTCTETVVSLPTEMHLCRPSHCVSPCIFANYSQNNWRTKVDSRTCSLLVMMLASHFGLNLLKSLSNVACSGIFRMSSQSLSA